MGRSQYLLNRSKQRFKAQHAGRSSNIDHHHPMKPGTSYDTSTTEEIPTSFSRDGSKSSKQQPLQLKQQQQKPPEQAYHQQQASPYTQFLKNAQTIVQSRQHQQSQQQQQAKQQQQKLVGSQPYDHNHLESKPSLLDHTEGTTDLLLTQQPSLEEIHLQERLERQRLEHQQQQIQLRQEQLRQQEQLRWQQHQLQLQQEQTIQQEQMRQMRQQQQIRNQKLHHQQRQQYHIQQKQLREQQQMLQEQYQQHQQTLEQQMELELKQKELKRQRKLRKHQQKQERGSYFFVRKGWWKRQQEMLTGQDESDEKSVYDLQKTLSNKPHQQEEASDEQSTSGISFYQNSSTKCSNASAEASITVRVVPDALSYLSRANQLQIPEHLAKTLEPPLPPFSPLGSNEDIVRKAIADRQERKVYGNDFSSYSASSFTNTSYTKLRQQRQQHFQNKVSALAMPLQPPSVPIQGTASQPIPVLSPLQAFKTSKQKKEKMKMTSNLSVSSSSDTSYQPSSTITSRKDTFEDASFLASLYSGARPKFDKIVDTSLLDPPPISGQLTTERLQQHLHQHDELQQEEVPRGQTLRQEKQWHQENSQKIEKQEYWDNHQKQQNRHLQQQYERHLKGQGKDQGLIHDELRPVQERKMKEKKVPPESASEASPYLKGLSLASGSYADSSKRKETLSLHVTRDPDAYDVSAASQSNEGSAMVNAETPLHRNFGLTARSRGFDQVPEHRQQDKAISPNQDTEQGSSIQLEDMVSPSSLGVSIHNDPPGRSEEDISFPSLKINDAFTITSRGGGYSTAASRRPSPSPSDVLMTYTDTENGDSESERSRLSYTSNKSGISPLASGELPKPSRPSKSRESNSVLKTRREATQLRTKQILQRLEKLEDSPKAPHKYKMSRNVEKQTKLHKTKDKSLQIPADNGIRIAHPNASSSNSQILNNKKNHHQSTNLKDINFVKSTSPADSAEKRKQKVQPSNQLHKDTPKAFQDKNGGGKHDRAFEPEARAIQDRHNAQDYYYMEEDINHNGYYDDDSTLPSRRTVDEYRRSTAAASSGIRNSVDREDIPYQKSSLVVGKAQEGVAIVASTSYDSVRYNIRSSRPQNHRDPMAEYEGATESVVFSEEGSDSSFSERSTLFRASSETSDLKLQQDGNEHENHNHPDDRDEYNPHRPIKDLEERRFQDKKHHSFRGQLNEQVSKTRFEAQGYHETEYQHTRKNKNREDHHASTRDPQPNYEVRHERNYHVDQPSSLHQVRQPPRHRDQEYDYNVDLKHSDGHHRRSPGNHEHWNRDTQSRMQEPPADSSENDSDLSSAFLMDVVDIRGHRGSRQQSHGERRDHKGDSRVSANHDRRNRQEHTQPNMESLHRHQMRLSSSKNKHAEILPRRNKSRGSNKHKSKHYSPEGFLGDDFAMMQIKHHDHPSRKNDFGEEEEEDLDRWLEHAMMSKSIDESYTVGSFHYEETETGDEADLDEWLDNVIRG